MTDHPTRFPFLCGVQPFEAVVAAVFRAAWKDEQDGPDYLPRLPGIEWMKEET